MGKAFWKAFFTVTLGFKGALAASAHSETAGQFILVEIAGTQLSTIEQNMIKKIRPSGFVLTSKNITSFDQVHGLLKSLQNLNSGVGNQSYFFALDDSNGMGLKTSPKIQSKFAFGIAPNVDRLIRYSAEIHKMVRSLGFNMHFSPMLDSQLETPQAFGTKNVNQNRRQDLLQLAIAFSTTAIQAKVVPVARHSTIQAISQSKSEEVETWLRTFSDLQPTAILSPMQNSLNLPKRDTASSSLKQLSLQKIHELWGYSGLIIKDLRGLEKQKSEKFRSQILAALKAGNDLIILRGSAATLLSAHQFITAALQSNDLNSKAAFEKTSRQKTVKETIATNFSKSYTFPKGNVWPSKELQQISEELTRDNYQSAKLMTKNQKIPARASWTIVSNSISFANPILEKLGGRAQHKFYKDFFPIPDSAGKSATFSKSANHGYLFPVSNSEQAKLIQSLPKNILNNSVVVLLNEVSFEKYQNEVATVLNVVQLSPLLSDLLAADL